MGIVQSFQGLLAGIASIPASVQRSLTAAQHATATFMRKTFGPRYEVSFVMYQVIPGVPVKPAKKKFSFERGAKQEAEDFYAKVISSTEEHRVMPSEVQLKRNGKVVASKVFGPVGQIVEECVMA